MVRGLQAGTVPTGATALHRTAPRCRTMDVPARVMPQIKDAAGRIGILRSAAVWIVTAWSVTEMMLAVRIMAVQITAARNSSAWSGRDGPGPPGI